MTLSLGSSLACGLSEGVTTPVYLGVVWINDHHEVNPDISWSRVPVDPPGKGLGISGGGTAHTGAERALWLLWKAAVTVPGLVGSLQPRCSNAVRPAENAPARSSVMSWERNEDAVTSVKDNLINQRPAIR